VADRFATVDDYIRSFPEDVQTVLEEVRRTIRSVAPGAEETISYQIPTITLGGKYLVYFAGWKQHISFYPLPNLDQGLEEEIAPYKVGKGTLRFPLGEPIPHDLIKKLVALLVQQRAQGSDRRLDR
jgi:uncharacterized protein YdhG (YjbR/CyaY superfamily)